MPNQYKNKVVYGDSVLMDITDTTAEAGDVANGAVFYAKNGARTVGTFTQAQSDWEEDDTTDPAFILNKPPIPSASNSTPLVDGVAAVGTSTNYARADHVHPVSSLSALSDTALYSPSNGQVLRYNTTTSKWENSTLPTQYAYGSTNTSDSNYISPLIASSCIVDDHLDLIMSHNTNEYGLLYFSSWNIAASANIIVSNVILYNNGLLCATLIGNAASNTWIFTVYPIQETLTIDTAMSSSSTNPVANSAITTAIANNRGKVFYGVVDNTSTATAFTAQIPGITAYEEGLVVILKNGVVTSASGFTININGLGALPVYTNLGAESRETTIFNVAYTMMFVYEHRVSGGDWLCYRGSDTNTIGCQLRTNSMSLPMKSITYRYRLLFTSADGAHFVPANNTTSTNATSSRAVCQDKIDPFGPIYYYYGTTASVAANSRPSAIYLWEQYIVSLGYSFNRTGAALTLSSWKPVYVKCAPQTDGSAIIDSTTPYVQVLPTTADGKIYIFLGVAYSATSIELVPHHPVYCYRNGGIQEWTGVQAEIDALTARINNLIDGDEVSY